MFIPKKKNRAMKINRHLEGMDSVCNCESSVKYFLAVLGPPFLDLYWIGLDWIGLNWIGLDTYENYSSSSTMQNMHEPAYENPHENPRIICCQCYEKCLIFFI